MRVLTVARWYPSHDSPGRGSFVADLVAATVRAGIEARVVSFDRVLIRGRVERRDADRAPALAEFERVATPASLFVTPVSYGAPGVPVARVPLVRRPGAGDVGALVEDHLDALRPFVRRLVATWRPDLIHAHTGLPDGVVACLVGRELGIPVVVSEHASTIETELADPAARERYRTLLEPDVKLLAVSPSLAGRIALAVGATADRIDVLTDPIADTAFPLADASGRDRNELLWVGSLGEHKGIDVLLHAFARVRASRPGVHLRLVGGERAGGERARWEALAGSLGVGPAVTFDGWLGRTGVAAAMAGAGVFVHPSPSETFGVVAAEAILTGLPVAARRSGGVPWIVELSGGYGRVAGDDGPEAFAEAIEAVIDGGITVDATTARARLASVVGTEAVSRRAVELYRATVPGSAGEEGGAVAAAGALDATVPTVPAAPAGLPRVILATGRDQARQLVARLPTGLQSRLVLVVPAPVGESPDPTSGSGSAVRIIEAEPVPPPKPRPRGRSPLARIRRLFFRPAPTGDELLAAAIANAARVSGGGPGSVDVVAIDAPAVALVARLGTGRVRLAPGSLRWLADRWDAES